MTHVRKVSNNWICRLVRLDSSRCSFTNEESSAKNRNSASCRDPERSCQTVPIRDSAGQSRRRGPANYFSYQGGQADCSGGKLRWDALGRNQHQRQRRNALAPISDETRKRQQPGVIEQIRHLVGQWHCCRDQSYKQQRRFASRIVRDPTQCPAPEKRSDATGTEDQTCESS